MIIERYTCKNNLALFKCRELNLKEFIAESQYYKDPPDKEGRDENTIFNIPVVIEIMEDKYQESIYFIGVDEAKK